MITTERTPTLAGYEPSSANALKPGPLDAGMVRLLTAGRSVLRAVKTTCTFCAGDLIEYEGPGPLGEVMAFGMSWMAARFEYVGERDDDGWITAPPGGWGSNPVPGRRVNVRLRDGVESPRAGADSDVYVWEYTRTNRAADIIAFRLVEEASPVGQAATELSGNAGELNQGSSAIEADTHRAADGAVLVPRDLFRFLLGEGSYDGHDFGDEVRAPGGRRLKYWWRKPLRACVGTVSPASQPGMNDGVAGENAPRLPEASPVGGGVRAYPESTGEVPPCDGCGGSTRYWHAANRLWNRVMGGPEAKGDPGGVLCPNCFIDRAATVGEGRHWVVTDTDPDEAPSAWRTKRRNHPRARWTYTEIEPSAALHEHYEVQALAVMSPRDEEGGTP